MAFVLGLGLSLVVGLGLQFGSVAFSKDKHVLHLITIGVPVSIYSSLKLLKSFLKKNLIT